jgi:hypothetical protein
VESGIRKHRRADEPVPPTIGLKPVYPSKPDSSVLIRRLQGHLPSGAALIRMPYLSNPLPADTIRIIRDRISQGAPKVATTVKPTRWEG